MTPEAQHMRDDLRRYIEEKWPARDVAAARALLAALLALERETMGEMICREAARHLPGPTRPGE